MSIIQDNKALLGILAASYLSYGAYIYLRKYWESNRNSFVPIGIVKELYIYPIKSCKGKSVFSLYCGPKGTKHGEIQDRYFQVIEGDTGRFYTARKHPTLVLVDANIENGKLIVKFPQGNEVSVDLESVKSRRDVRKTTLHANLRTDGLDCGEEISAAFSAYLNEKNVRVVFYTDDLFTERTSVSKSSFWMNNPVPKRIDDVAYADLAPFMVQTEASLHDLQALLPDKDLSQLNFRPGIVIDKCPAWDEDKWLDLRFGETELQCYKPCTRCILTTVNPKTGEKDPDMQPLKKLREVRMAPAGPMKKEFKDSPIFGVNAGLTRPGFIHVGQVVYARYKPSAF
ncbi:unnamed protein product [Auanema sp. JU1783]|nr:unnamed protein product [Auanema sp. JU1783]